MLPEAFDMFWRPTLDFLRQGTNTKSVVPPITSLPNTSFKDAIRSMVPKEEKGEQLPLVHRLFITKEERAGNRLDGIVSMTDVISVLAEGSGNGQ